jgi:hypothetical protein
VIYLSVSIINVLLYYLILIAIPYVNIVFENVLTTRTRRRRRRRRRTTKVIPRNAILLRNRV